MKHATKMEHDRNNQPPDDLEQEQSARAERVVEIVNDDGLHMRPAMLFVECANTFSSRVRICKDSQTVDGKSIMQITMLAATRGTKLKIVTEGRDAAQAAEALAAILQQSGSQKPTH